MKQYKKNVLRATDIDPNCFYLAQTHSNSKVSSLEPCKVICTEVQGWKRGYVAFDADEHGVFKSDVYGTFHAVLKFLDSKIGSRNVALQGTADSFYFVDVTGHPTLMPLTPAWLETRRATIEAELCERQRILLLLNALDK